MLIRQNANKGVNNMSVDELNSVTDIVKNASEAAKNFQSIIDSILQPRGIDLAIIDGHKKIIENYLSNDQENIENKVAFLSRYKQMIKEYKNCKKVADIAAPFVCEEAKPKDVDEDWFAFFFDKVRLVSNENFQQMWGRVLAEEVNRPDTFQRSLLQTLSIMNQVQAEFFCNFSRFCMYEYKKEEIIHPLIFISSNVEAYQNSKITRSKLIELQTLGLIQCDFKDEYVFLTKKMLRYGNKVITIFGDPNNDNKIKSGNVMLTDNGRTLYKIVDDDFKRYRADILDFAITKFQRRNCKILINDKEVV